MCYVDQLFIHEEQPLLSLDISSSVGMTVNELKEKTAKDLETSLIEYEKHKAANMDLDIYSGVRNGHVPLKS